MVPYVDIIDLCNSVEILREIYVMQQIFQEEIIYIKNLS